MNPTKHKQDGLSLPELMVAILLGTIVTTAVIGMYLSTSRNFSQDERYALMQENGRYAIRVLAEDLMMADFWGTITAPDNIRNTSLTVSEDCGAGDPGSGNGIDLLGDTTAAKEALLYNDGHTGSSLFTPCTELSDLQRPGTDVLVVKRVEGKQDSSGSGVRVRVSGTNASLVNSGTPVTGETDWLYMPRMYYIRTCFSDDGSSPAPPTCLDNIPSLCRMGMTGTGLGGANGLDHADCIAEGIEDFHIQFGVDTDNDGIANQYKSSPSLAELEQAVSARIYVVARSSAQDPYFTDTKVFTLGDVCSPGPELPVAAGGPGCTTANNDNYYRRLFTTTVMIRNVVNLNLLNN